MNSKFEEILNLANSLSFTSFPIEDDVLNLQNSLKSQTTSLIEFNDSFNSYCNGVRDMEENICSVFSKISGITEEISEFRGVSAISENGQIDKNKVMQLMLKNPADLTKEEKEILEYAKIVLGEDEYKKIKETVFTYEEARKYINSDILGLNIGLKTYFPNEISNLPKQITYEKDGYIYIYVLTENSPLTFNGIKLNNEDTISKDGQVISTKMYSYNLIHTNEPKISTGTVFVSPTKEVSEAILKKKSIPDFVKKQWEAGNNFNKENRPRYPYNEVELEAKEINGKKYVVDSYVPGKEIVSRKFTQLAEVQEKTALGYLSEFTKKYSSGSEISSGRFNPNALKGGRLEGELILEVPVQTKPVP